MKKLAAGLINVLSTGLVVACSTPQVRVLSDPAGVEVFASQQGSADKRSIGKTPLEVTFRDLREKFGFAADTGDFFVFSFESPEFEAQTVLVPSMGTGVRTLTVRTHLEPRKDAKTANAILSRIHVAQKFAQSGNYERAQIECDKVLEIDSHIVRALSLKASIYYLQKNYSEALKWYEKALAEDNSFDEAIKMIARIKQERP